LILLPYASTILPYALQTHSLPEGRKQGTLFAQHQP